MKNSPKSVMAAIDFVRGDEYKLINPPRCPFCHSSTELTKDEKTNTFGVRCTDDNYGKDYDGDEYLHCTASLSGYNTAVEAVYAWAAAEETRYYE